MGLLVLLVASGCSKGDVEYDKECPTWFVEQGGQVWQYVECTPPPSVADVSLQTIWEYGAAVWRATEEAKPTATPLPPQPTATSVPRLRADVSAEVGGIDAFRQGYLDYGGNPAWLDHFVYDVMPCEGGELWHEFGDYSGSGYISSAQFHPGTWASAVAATGRSNPYSAYDVGANVGYWASAVSDPWGSGGWPVCGHRGGW